MKGLNFVDDNVYGMAFNANLFLEPCIWLQLGQNCSEFTDEQLTTVTLITSAFFVALFCL